MKTPRSVACFVAALLAACSDVPGDPDTFVVDGEPVAGYAWSGPGSYPSGDVIDDRRHVGWQIWFTNTDECPLNGNAALGWLLIVSPELVSGPSTELPTLPSLTVPIEDTAGRVTEPMARLGAESLYSGDGTLTLTTYRTDEIAGSFTAMSRTDHGTTVDVRGSFVARRCGRIQD